MVEFLAVDLVWQVPPDPPENSTPEAHLRAQRKQKPLKHLNFFWARSDGRTEIPNEDHVFVKTAPDSLTRGVGSPRTVPQRNPPWSPRKGIPLSDPPGGSPGGIPWGIPRGGSPWGIPWWIPLGPTKQPCQLGKVGPSGPGC